MLDLNKSEAETLQRFLDGDRLWSWPNGSIQLGQSFPDVTIINRLVREGLLDQNYQPTDAACLALQSPLTAKTPSPSLLLTPDEDARKSLSAL